MREIKFRVWDNIDYMSTNFTLKDLQEKTVQFTDECTTMQFTGLLDKNGKEIYEGDIVKVFRYNNVNEIVPVYWKVEWGKWCWTHDGFAFDVANANGSEIVGNIYENPELLTHSEY